jgi:hypothetical protein
MSPSQKKREERRATGALRLDAIGLEAEFTPLVDGVPTRPEELFGDPRSFLDGEPMHRAGTSYHLPTGGAVYFDTGVIEIATPVIEVAPGCAARAGRSLWEGILHVRKGLDRWQEEDGREVRLEGFSTHYNVSVSPTVRRQPLAPLALSLCHLLAPPVILLACNRRSSGVGVRPRGNRVEITVDFTPSAALMIATGLVITAIVREVLRWPSLQLRDLERHGVPLLAGLEPMPHTSRRGWLARADCFPRSPFTTDPDARVWRLRGGGTASLREVARGTVERFWGSIVELAEPATLPLLIAVLEGRAPSLLELPDRPEAYSDVGHLCRWDCQLPRGLGRSLYEGVLIRAIAGRPLRLAGSTWTPVGMNGWTEVVFLRRSGARISLPVDELIRHLDRW